MAQRLHVMICTCTNCISNGALTIKNALESEIGKKELSEDVQVVQTGASGLCVKGPILIVQPEGIFYQLLTLKDVPGVVEERYLVLPDKVSRAPKEYPRREGIPAKRAL